MIKSIYIKSEFKKIFREPIMTLLLFAPLLIPIAFRLLTAFLVPFIQKYVSFDFALYEHYVLSFTLILCPMMLSMVVGFSMIDDKDNRIVELMSITPMGKTRYILLRLLLVFMLVVVYSVYSYLVLGIYIISLWTLLYLIIILSIYSAIMGLLLFSIATDKVKGLTYAKGLSAVMLFAFVDLLNLDWLNAIAGFFPPYWITKVIAEPNNIFALAAGLVVSIIWFIIFLAKTKL